LTPPFRCFVFDFDGTLIDSNHLKKSAFFELAAEFSGGLEAMEKLHQDIVGDRFMIWADWAKAVGRSQEFGNMMALRYSQRVDDLVANAPEMPGATALLNYLRSQDKSVFLSSATPRKNLIEIIEKRGIHNYFTNVFGSPMTKFDALKKWVIPTVEGPEFVAVIGDGADDMDSATRAKCTFFAVGEAGRATGDKSMPTYSLHQLISYLQTHK